MVAALALLSVMDAIAKFLTMQGVTVIQILALRSLLIVPVLILVFYLGGNSRQLRPVNAKAHMLRGFIGFTAPLCFFIGITHIPLTDAVVIFFSSAFFITLLSIFALGEKVGVHRWASVIVGFIGVLIVVGPKGGGQLSGYLLVLAGSLSYAILFISGRYLSATETVVSLVLSYNLCTGIVSLILLPFFWTELNNSLVLYITILAALALCGHYLMTMAFSKAEASLLAPFEYTTIFWALILDLLVWQVSPTISTIIGAVIIMASGLYIVHRENISKSA